MIVTAVKTPKITSQSGDIYAVLDSSLPTLHDGDIVVITSKIVSICEGSIIPVGDIDKEDLIEWESDLYLPKTSSAYGFHFTITNNTLIPMAGVDESNGDGYYILWPRDAQQTANDIRQYLAEKHNLSKVGVLITDSTCQPQRAGTGGISLAQSGFAALRSYIGTPDLFGRPLAVTQANVAGGLSAAAVVMMGEGTEQTPLCLISDVPSVTFQDRDPSAEELQAIQFPLDKDIFEPFLTAVKWLPGKRTSAKN